MSWKLSVAGIVLVVSVGGAAYGQVTTRASVNSSGVQGNAMSVEAAISPTGRWLAFVSLSTNLVVGDGNLNYDVFLRDRDAGTTECVSLSTGGATGNGASYVHLASAISADGRYVAFWSSATNLVAGDVNAWEDVFVRDRQAGTTEIASLASGGAQGNQMSSSPALSADGRYVAFLSPATNLAAGGTNGLDQVYVRDRQAGTTELVSVDSGGTQGDDDSFAPSISADGRYVAFASVATNLVVGDTNGLMDVFVHDRQAGTTERVSVATGGAQGDEYCGQFSEISADGRYVAFESSASNLTAGDVNFNRDVFVHDRQTGTTDCVSLNTSGVPDASIGSFHPAISADGRYVAFDTSAQLIPADTAVQTDIYVRDRQTGTSEIADYNSAVNPPPANGASVNPSLSDDGNLVAFESEANNLVPLDTNGPSDVFVRDRTDPGSSDFASVCDPGAGGVINCPCGNPPSGSGRGCDNSNGTGGASLSANGNTELSADGVVFTTSGENASVLSLVMQGKTVLASGVAYGQGVRCINTSLKRLYVKQASGGSITAPDFFIGDLPVSARSSQKGDVIQPGESRWYSVFYREPSNFPACTGVLKVNATQVLRISWSG